MRANLPHMHHLSILCQLMPSTVQQMMRNSRSQEWLAAAIWNVPNSEERRQATPLQAAQLQAAKLQQSILITALAGSMGSLAVWWIKAVRVCRLLAFSGRLIKEGSEEASHRASRHAPCHVIVDTLHRGSCPTQPLRTVSPAASQELRQPYGWLLQQSGGCVLSLQTTASSQVALWCEGRQLFQRRRIQCCVHFAAGPAQCSVQQGAGSLPHCPPCKAPQHELTLEDPGGCWNRAHLPSFFCK